MPRSKYIDGSAIIDERLSISRTNLLLISAGSIFHMVAEASLVPLFVALIYYYVGMGMGWPRKFWGGWERNIYTRVFLAGFMAAGISALYRTFSGDLQGDAEHFYEFISGTNVFLSLEELASLTSGGGAIFVWREVLNFMVLIGFPQKQYVAVFINVLIVAWSGVITLKMVRLIYGDDSVRFKRLILIFSSCGLFWLYSGLLVRDSFVLIAVSLLTYAWLYFLNKPDRIARLFLVLAVSFIAVIYFGYVRVEFFFVPLIMPVAAVAALIFRRNSGQYRAIACVISIILLLMIGIVLESNGDLIEMIISRGSEVYGYKSAEESGAGSLGMSLIVNQPMPIRLPLGIIYLYLFPIPFWDGFQFEAVYFLFKSINVLLFYFLIPLLIMAIYTIWKDAIVRSPSMLFLVFFVVGISLIIAGTTLETRHIGAFFSSLFLIALLPDMQLKKVRIQYRKVLIAFLGTVFIIHYSWAIMKMGLIIINITIGFILFILIITTSNRKNRLIYQVLAIVFLSSII